MGVPSLFAWWVEHYLPNILLSNFIMRGQRKILYLDFNGLIHPAVRNEIIEFSTMITSVTVYLEKVFNSVKPDELYIAVDGVAPAAKMKQQQDRRYKSAKEAKFMHDISIKYKKPVREIPVDFNMISPGTQFMFDLHKHLNLFISEKCSKGKDWENIKVTLNGADVPGEGEHKIMAEIRTREALNLHETSIIYGLDADLIFLSLLNCPNAFLMRENVQFKNRDKTDYFDTEKFPFVYLDVKELKTIIVETLSPKTHIDKLVKKGFKNDIIHESDIDLLCLRHSWFSDTAENHKRLIVDYTFICFFLGNDFLPHLPGLKIKNGSLNEILIIYKKISWLKGDFLVSRDGSDINTTFLAEFLSELAFIEIELLDKLETKRQKDIKYFSYRLKNIDPMDAEIDRFRYVEDTYGDELRVKTAGWNKRFYTKYHIINTDNSVELNKQIDKISESYLKGLLWILYYYQGKDCEWNWCYPYIAAPTAEDLSGYYSNNKGSKKRLPIVDEGPVDPFVQLMSVLPPDSASLLPDVLKYYMTNPSSHIHYMYPIKIHIHSIGHKWYHESKALIPYIDRTILKQITLKHKQDYTPEEITRSQNTTDVKTWNE